MLLNPDLSAALDRVAERAADVRRAFTPGAVPQNDDAAVSTDRSDFTLDPLSVALPGGTYFMTLDVRGRTAYVRDGSFALRDGRLVDAGGLPVLGYAGPGSTLGELRLDAVDNALGRATNMRIEADGTLVYARAGIDPRSGKAVGSNVIVGRIALARFPAGTKLDTADGRSFAAPSGVTPHVGLAEDGTFGALSPMRRARSHIDLDTSLLRLKDAYTAFDALAAAESAKQHFHKAAMDVVK